MRCVLVEAELKTLLCKLVGLDLGANHSQLRRVTGQTGYVYKRLVSKVGVFGGVFGIPLWKTFHVRSTITNFQCLSSDGKLQNLNFMVFSSNKTNFSTDISFLSTMYVTWCHAKANEPLTFTCALPYKLIIEIIVSFR